MDRDTFDADNDMVFIEDHEPNRDCECEGLECSPECDYLELLAECGCGWPGPAEDCEDHGWSPRVLSLRAVA